MMINYIKGTLNTLESILKYKYTDKFNLCNKRFLNYYVNNEAKLLSLERKHGHLYSTFYHLEPIRKSRGTTNPSKVLIVPLKGQPVSLLNDNENLTYNARYPNHKL